MPHLPCRGFTWLEILIVLAILSILATVAVPSLSDAIARHRLRAATTALLDTLTHTRAAALQRAGGAFVCPSENGRTCSGRGDWAMGWLSRDADTKDILAVEDALDSRLNAISTGVRTDIVFSPRENDTARPTNQTLALCLRGKPATTVTVVIARNGHSHVEPAPADIARTCGAHHSLNR